MKKLYVEILTNLIGKSKPGGISCRASVYVVRRLADVCCGSDSAPSRLCGEISITDNQE